MKTLISPGVVQVMIDIETLDVRPNSRILSVASVPFILDAAEEIDFLTRLEARGLPGSFHEHVELPQILEANATFKWHLTTGTGALEESARKGLKLEATLGRLHRHVSAWAPEDSDYYIWGWGYGFDMTILAEAYRRCQPSLWQARTYHASSGPFTELPYTFRPPDIAMEVGDPHRSDYDLPYWLECYWRSIDARSVFFSHGGFWKEYSESRQGKHHDALDDVRHQIKVIQQIYSADA